MSLVIRDKVRRNDEDATRCGDGNTYYRVSGLGGLSVPRTSPASAATSRDVAKAANVSQALVSRAFSGNGRIAPETRDRILRVAAEIGWRPNALAASMVTGDAPRF